METERLIGSNHAAPFVGSASISYVDERVIPMLFGPNFYAKIALMLLGVLTAMLVGIVLLAWGISVLFALPYWACLCGLVLLIAIDLWLRKETDKTDG
ncbi:hypothetical protein [Brevibacillus laterosporus]|uniref:hypothetical protein n=1 Tax=Brevibacillus laterosporus TaxID=1465 RepID=UPI000EB32AC9|nr:hypothetical protein [Brevibacillus laterosporus]AYK07767.1 hypothetical protein D8Z77_16095 [Brevibacillus laterosporus]